MCRRSENLLGGVGARNGQPVMHNMAAHPELPATDAQRADVDRSAQVNAGSHANLRNVSTETVVQAHHRRGSWTVALVQNRSVCGEDRELHAWLAGLRVAHT